jgi:hypothetical protein
MSEIEKRPAHGLHGPNAEVSVYTPSTGLVVAFYGVIGAMALFPLLMVSLPPLADLPNHLARAYIINNLGASPDLQRYYAIEWQPLTFQSIDLILPWLGRLVGLELAARLYIAAGFVAIVGGVVLLHFILFRRVGLWPAVSALLLFNFMLAWGLVSVLLAIGLAIALLAAWIATRDREGVLLTLIFAAGALLIFVCHFFVFAVYAVLIAAFEMGRLLQKREWSKLLQRLLGYAATVVVPLLIFLAAPKSDTPNFNAYGGIDDKIRAIISPVTMYITWPDYVIALSAIGLVAFARRQKLIAFRATMAWPLLAITLCTVLMPSQLLSVWGADFRLPTVLMLLLVAATELRLGSKRAAITFVGLVAGLMLFRCVTVTLDWRRMDADFAEFQAATGDIARGSRIIAVQSTEDHRPAPAPNAFPYRHVAALAVIERDVFHPLLFTKPTRPLRFVGAGTELESNQVSVMRPIGWHPARPEFAGTDAATVGQVEQIQERVQAFELVTSTTDWSDWPEHFDYLIDFSYGVERNPVPGLLTEVRRGSYFTIFKIHPPGRP